MKRSVTVTMFGREFTFRSEASEDRLQGIADFVNRKAEEIQRSTRTVDSMGVALLTAMNIAEELFSEREERSERWTEVEATAERLVDRIDRELEAFARAKS